MTFVFSYCVYIIGTSRRVVIIGPTGTVPCLSPYREGVIDTLFTKQGPRLDLDPSGYI